MLTKLENGNWIDLTAIRSISTCKEEKGFSVPIGPRVVVRSHDNVEVVYFASLAEAGRYTDKLAEKANEQSEKRNDAPYLLAACEKTVAAIEDLRSRSGNLYPTEFIADAFDACKAAIKASK